jgi:hypothetical protein
MVHRLLHELYHAQRSVSPMSLFGSVKRNATVAFFRVIPPSCHSFNIMHLLATTNHACMRNFWMVNGGWNDCAMILRSTRQTDHLQLLLQQDGRDIQPESSVATLGLDSCHVTTPYAYLVGYQASGFEAGLTTAIRLRPQQCHRFFTAVCFTQPAFAALCSILVFKALPLQNSNITAYLLLYHESAVPKATLIQSRVANKVLPSCHVVQKLVDYQVSNP